LYGLHDQHSFDLNFELRLLSSSTEEQSLVQTASPFGKHNVRSVSAEIMLEPGTYVVYPRVTAKRHENIRRIEDAFCSDVAKEKSQKFQRVARNYDWSHRRLEDPPGWSNASQDGAETAGEGTSGNK
jgi:hypothetical protein